MFSIFKTEEPRVHNSTCKPTLSEPRLGRNIGHACGRQAIAAAAMLPLGAQHLVTPLYLGEYLSFHLPRAHRRFRTARIIWYSPKHAALVSSMKRPASVKAMSSTMGVSQRKGTSTLHFNFHDRALLSINAAFGTPPKVYDFYMEACIFLR